MHIYFNQTTFRFKGSSKTKTFLILNAFFFESDYLDSFASTIFESQVAGSQRNILIYLFHLRHFIPMNGLENKTMNIESNDDLENKCFQ